MSEHTLISDPLPLLRLAYPDEPETRGSGAISDCLRYILNGHRLDLYTVANAAYLERALSYWKSKEQRLPYRLTTNDSELLARFSGQPPRPRATHAWVLSHDEARLLCHNRRDLGLFPTTAWYELRQVGSTLLAGGLSLHRAGNLGTPHPYSLEGNHRKAGDLLLQASVVLERRRNASSGLADIVNAGRD